MFEFKLPELAENVTSATVSKILVSSGETIGQDQNVIELETEKAAMEVPCPQGGVIKEILVKEGDEVKIGQVILHLDSQGAQSEKSEQKETPAPKTQKSEEAKDAKATKEPKEETKPQARPQPQPVQQEKFQPASAASRADVPAAPSVRRFAREIGLDIREVPGSGRGGRISIDDVKAHAKRLNTGRAGAAPAAAVRPLPDFTKWGAAERKPMNNVRKKTAEHLSYCWQTIPHVTQFDKADITELEKTRKKYSTKERRLTITPFLMKVMAAGLKEFPQFNSSVDMSTNEIIYKTYCHIGVAVDTDRGLLVPVVRDVDKKSIHEIADELTAMAERARNKKTSLDELQGGSMTLTNLGGIGGAFFTPIVNWPEVAILGVSRGTWEPVFTEEDFVPRFELPLSLSYDHRIIDGADGARFLRWVCEAIEQPFAMEL
jgi:pyruvate dehydrogenase E2 component (dihydrolipoamide acetyltransferase)